MKTWIQFGFALSILSIATPGLAEELCAEMVSRQVARVRQEILVANRIDQTAERPGARISNFIEGRAVEIDSSQVNGSHVISLGSGPDIFLPLYLYPHAKYFHLVDLLTGWGSGPDHVKLEIEARLRSLPHAPAVERLKSSEGLSWRVKWQDSQRESHEKIFFLHEMDFRAIENLEKLTASFDSPGLGGVVITGIGASLEVRKFLLQRLHAGGSMYTEMLFTGKDGALFDSEDQNILSELGKNHGIADFGIHDLGFKFTPHRILITPQD